VVDWQRPTLVLFPDAGDGRVYLLHCGIAGSLQYAYLPLGTLMVVIIVLIKLTSRGPAIFRPGPLRTQREALCCLQIPLYVGQRGEAQELAFIEGETSRAAEPGL
jgi:hypothetical protein